MFRHPSARTRPSAAPLCREVHVYFGDALQEVVHLTPPRPYVVGRDASDDLRLDDRLLRGASHLLEQPGSYHFGAVRVDVMPVAAAPEGTFPRRSQRDGAAWRAWLGSAGLHALVLLLFALAPPHSAALSLSELARESRLSYLETYSVETPEWIEEQPDIEEPDDAPAASEPAGAGMPARPSRSATPRPRPNGQASKAPTSLGPAPAAAAGIAEILRSAGLNVEASSTYSAAEAKLLGDSAVGSALSDSLTGGVSFGGLAMHGIGRGTQGDATGTIGAAVGTVGSCVGERCGSYGAVGGGLRQRTGRVPPRVRVGHPEVRGSLSKEVIRRVIHRQLAAVRHCYEQRLTARPDLSGRLGVRILIRPTGVVQQAGITSSTLGDATAETCVRQVMQRLTFPAPQGLVVVDYPFTFARMQ